MILLIRAVGNLVLTWGVAPLDPALEASLEAEASTAAAAAAAACLRGGMVGDELAGVWSSEG